MACSCFNSEDGMTVRILRPTVLNVYDIDHRLCHCVANYATRCRISRMLTTPKTLAAPITRLIAPRLALASCVRAIIVRDTTGAAPLPPAQRLNRFPAVPMCCIVWTIKGELEAAGPGLSLADVRMLPALVGGPRSYPLVSYNPAPVHSFIVMFYPAALHALTGVSMDALLDQFLPLDTVFDADWQVLSGAVLAAPDDEARIRLLEAFLAPGWRPSGRRHAGLGAPPGCAGRIGRVGQRCAQYRAPHQDLGRPAHAHLAPHAPRGTGIPRRARSHLAGHGVMGRSGRQRRLCQPGPFLPRDA